MFEMFLIFTVMVVALCMFLPKLAAKILTPKTVCAMLFALVFTNFAYAVDGTEVEWMAKISAFIMAIPTYLDLLIALLAAIIAIALVIPGEQPEKTLKAIVDFLSKFSKKPKQ